MSIFIYFTYMNNHTQTNQYTLKINIPLWYLFFTLPSTLITPNVFLELKIFMGLRKNF